MGKYKRNLFILLGIIVLILCLIICFYKIKETKKFNYKLEIVNEYNYLLFSENNKFGVINKFGEIVIMPKYDAIQIPNPSKPLFICMDNYNYATDEYNITVLNEKNEQILYEYIIVEAIQINNSSNINPYEKSVLKYKQNGKYGLINFDGKKITEPIYQDIQGVDFKEGLLLVKQNNQYGVININGIIVIDIEYSSIICDGYYSEENKYENAGFIVSKKDSEGFRYGYINSKGKKVLDIVYNELNRIIDKKDDANAYFIAFKNGRAALLKNDKNITEHNYEDIIYDNTNNALIMQRLGKQGFFSFEGESIIPIEYENIFISGNYIVGEKDNNFEIFDNKGNKQKTNYVGMIGIENSNYLIVITKDDLYGVIDTNQNILIKEEYESLKYLYNDYFIAIKDGKYGIIDINENVVINFEYDIIQQISGSKVLQGINVEEKAITIINSKLEKVKIFTNAHIYVDSKYVKIYSENDVLYVDYDGNEINKADIIDNNLFAIKVDEKWGFVNKNNNIVVQPIYEMVTEFNNYGFAGIKLDGKWGSINEDGEIIQEPIYQFDMMQPEFVGKYYKVDLGYGEPYFTSEN